MTYGEAYDEALREIAHLEEVNGSLCAEINRQERVIEHKRELIANRDESIRNLVKLLDKRQERIRALESLVRDMREYMTGGTEYCLSCAVRDNCDLDIYGDDCGMRGVFESRMAELGLEVDA